MVLSISVLTHVKNTPQSHLNVSTWMGKCGCMLNRIPDRQIRPASIPSQRVPFRHSLSIHFERGRGLETSDHNQADSSWDSRSAQRPQSGVPSSGGGLQSFQERSSGVRKESQACGQGKSSTMTRSTDRTRAELAHANDRCMTQRTRNSTIRCIFWPVNCSERGAKSTDGVQALIPGRIRRLGAYEQGSSFRHPR